MSEEVVNNHLLKFPINLREYRKEKGFSQNEVAEKLHISLRKYQRLESGEALPKLDEIYYFTNMFGIGFEDLLNNSNKTVNGFSIGEREGYDPKFIKKFNKALKDIIQIFEECVERRERSLDRIVENSLFYENGLPFIISDFNFCYTNQAYKNFAKTKGLDIVNKIPSKELWHNLHDFLAVSNKLIDSRDTYYSFSADIIKMGEFLDGKHLGYYTQRQYAHFSLCSFES